MLRKVIKFLKHNFSVTKLFSSQELNQTDFGRIYFNLPKETAWPSTTSELARTLEQYHKLGKHVTIRNTGHSANGQTLTDGVQVNIGNIKKLRFNRQTMEVTAGAGNTWHEVLEAVGFPRNCLPIFPNNPGQQIKIGGTASVGGVGLLAGKNGGFWNHILRLKLVTMTGEIIDCSPDRNADYFRYAIAGFGRIGVISELTVRVVPSVANISLLIGYFRDESKFMRAMDQAVADPMYAGIMSAEGFVKLFGARRSLNKQLLCLLVEMGPDHTADAVVEHTKKTLGADLLLFGHEENHRAGSLNVGMHIQSFSKRDIVYWYPTITQEDQLGLAHPWVDCAVRPDRYLEFYRAARKIVAKHDLEQYLVTQTMWHYGVDVDANMLGAYCMKRLHKDALERFPLSLELADAPNYAALMGIFPNVPVHKLQGALKAATELTNLTYRFGGKRYLYGLHSLTKAQVETHFGRTVIQQWQKIKDQLDPKHLLNIGVIEHLD